MIFNGEKIESTKEDYANLTLFEWLHKESKPKPYSYYVVKYLDGDLSNISKLCNTSNPRWWADGLQPQWQVRKRDTAAKATSANKKLRLNNITNFWAKYEVCIIQICCIS